MKLETIEQNKKIYAEVTEETLNHFNRLCRDCQEDLEKGISRFEKYGNSRHSRLSCVCGETNNLACDWGRSDHMKCPKCQKIQIPFVFPANCNFVAEWLYIFYDAIDEKGVEWYIKARDKLIKKIDKYYENEQRKASLKKSKIINNIRKWC